MTAAEVREHRHNLAVARIDNALTPYAESLLPITTAARDIAEARRYAALFASWTARVALPAALKAACVLSGLLLAGLAVTAVTAFALLVLAVAAVADVAVIAARHGFRLACVLAPVVAGLLWRLLAALVIGAEAVHGALYKLAGWVMRGRERAAA